MERFKSEERIVQLQCYDSHIFHKDCLEEWVADHNQTKCPYCETLIK